MSLPKLTAALVAILLVVAMLGNTAHAASTLSSSNIEVNESSSVATFTFTLTEPNPEGTTTFDYHTVDGSATAPSDYQSMSGQLNFPPSSDTESVTVQIPLHPDTADESNETFSIAVTNIPQYIQTSGTSWTATIVDDDQPPVTAPVTPTPTPSATTTAPTEEPGTTETTNPPTTEETKTEIPQMITAAPDDPEIDLINHRSAFVRSVPDPKQVDWSPKSLLRSAIIAFLLILLIVFPSELFNGTLQENYDEVASWFKTPRLHKLTTVLHRHVPLIFSLVFFTALGALINSFLSPDFGKNQASAALFLGMFVTTLVCSFVFDIVRRSYMHHRFRTPSRLRTHALGLVFAALLVLAARLTHLLPGYVYGMFTGLVFSGERQPSDKEDGHGMAVFTLGLLAVAAAGWFAWIPVRQAAIGNNPGFGVLIIDAVLASLWVGALCSIVFGLLPIRFSNGEQIKKWSTKGWVMIYALGIFLFVHTLLSPNQQVYGHAEGISLWPVLALFLGFGWLSVVFWGYFRYRHLWRSS